MEKEEELLIKRCLDLANKADKSNRPVSGDFLNLNEQNIVETIRNQLSFADVYFWGGYNMAERKAICFCPKNMELKTEWFNIECIRIKPLNQKFADKLTHRDFLGAIINTGIERNKIGDIVVNRDESYFYCSANLADFLCNELTRVKHTSVMLELDKNTDVDGLVSENFKIIFGSISSLRADSVTALAIRGSRTLSEEVISSKRLYVNAKLITKKDTILRLGDVLSIRGYGKYIIDEIGKPNSKNRMKVSLKAYQ